jgi:hypothetical protein
MRCAKRLVRPLAAFALLVQALASAGCFPNAAWLPDSSGFIYTAGKGSTRLIHYDMAKGEKHVLVDDTGAGTNWPAVSPDGERIAVAKVIVQPGKKQTTLQVILYSSAGKEMQRSKIFDWMETNQPAPAGKAPKDPTLLPQLFWVPDADQILVSTAGYKAIYDVKADRLLHAGEGWLLIFGNTPVRPDGGGYLVMKNARNWLERKDKDAVPDPGFAFVDWSGKEQPLKSPGLLTDRDALQKEKDANKLIGLLCPYLFQSRWDGNVAQVSWHGDRLRYLIGKGEVVLDRIEKARTKDGVAIIKEHEFPEGQAQVRLVLTSWDEKNPQKDGIPRIEIVKAGQKEPKVLVERVHAVMAPAPNGKFVALRTLPHGGGKPGSPQVPPMVIVVNDRGEVVARVPVDR